MTSIDFFQTKYGFFYQFSKYSGVFIAKYCHCLVKLCFIVLNHFPNPFEFNLQIGFNVWYIFIKFL